MGSNFTRKALRDADAFMNMLMPGFIYNMTLDPLKGYLSNMSGIKEALENDKKDG